MSLLVTVRIRSTYYLICIEWCLREACLMFVLPNRTKRVKKTQRDSVLLKSPDVCVCVCVIHILAIINRI